MKLFFIEIYMMAENSSFSISQWLKTLLELFNEFNEDEQTYPMFFAGSFWY
jgi:hypothetical protein